MAEMLHVSRTDVRNVLTLLAILCLLLFGSIEANATWIDAATGQPEMTIPVNGGPPLNDAPAQNAHMLSNTLVVDRDSPHAVTNGKDLYWDKQCYTWRDAASGAEVLTIPVNGGPPLNDAGAQNAHMLSNTLGFDRDHPHAVTNGKTLFWQPCPPPTPPQTSWTGPFIGLQLAGVWSGVRTSENLASTGMRTNLFNDSGSTVGGGINAGFNWQLPNSPFVVGGVLTLNGMNDTVTHNFLGGSSIGSTVNFTAAAEARAGYLATPNVLIYGQTGIAVAHQNVQLNFGGATSSRSQLTPGYALGAGVEWQPPISPLFPTTASPAGGWTMSVFAQYDHIWWDKATLNAPSASPFYNYGWSRQSDMFTVGVRLRH